MKTFFLIIGLILTFSLGHTQTIPDTTELKAFWESRVMPIMEIDKETVKSYVEFPLQGDWGYLIDIDTPSGELTQEDFFNGYDQIFQKSRIERLNVMNYRDIRVHNENNEYPDLSITIFTEEIIDGFNVESALMLLFSWIDNEYRLSRIMFAG